MGRIRVRVIRGELPRAMSYYVRLAVPGHVRRTRSSEEAEDPRWGDTFDLPVRGVKEGAVLHLTLHDSAEADGVQDDVEMNEATLGGAAVLLNDIVQPYAWVERTVPMAGGSVVVAVFGADTEDNDDLESPKPAPSIDKAARAHINKIATSDASPDDHSPAPGHRHSLTEQEVTAEAAARVAAMRAPLEGSPDGGEEHSDLPGKAGDKADEDDGYGDDFDSPQAGSPQPKDDADEEEKEDNEEKDEKDEKDDDGYGDEDFEDEASEKADEASEKGDPADVSEKDDASAKASEKDEPDAPSEKDEADKVSEKASEVSDKGEEKGASDDASAKDAAASEKDASPEASEKDSASQKASEKASEKAEEASEKDDFEAESEKDAVSQKGSAKNDNGSEEAESAKAESGQESANAAEKEPEPERSMKDEAASSGEPSAPPSDDGSESAVEAVGGVMAASGKRSATPPDEEPAQELPQDGGQPSTLEDLEAAADEAEAAAVAAEANADEAEAEMHAEVDASFQQDAADGAGGNDDGAEEDEYGDDDYEASDHGHPEEPKEEGDQDPRPEAPESKTPEESRPATQPTPPAEAPLEKAPEPDHDAEDGDDVGSVDAPSDDFEGSSSAGSAAKEEPAQPQHRPAPPTAEQQVRQPAPPTAPPSKGKRASAVAKPPARASPKKPKAPAQRSPKKPAPPRDDSWESGSDGEHATPSGPRLHLRVVAARGLPPDASQRVFVRAGVTQGAPAEESCFTNGVHETQDGRAIARRSFVGDGSSTELAFSSDFRMAVPEPAKDSLVVQLRDRAGALLGHASVALAGLRQRAWLYRWLRMADGAAVRVGLFGSDLGTEERAASEAPTEQHDHDPQTIVASHGGDSVTVDVDAAFMRACEHLAISPEKLRARPPSEFMRRGEPEAVGRRRYDLFQASRLKWLYAVVAERERILAQADQKPLAKTAPTPRPPPPRTNGEKPYATPAFAVPPKAKTLTPRPPAAHGDDMLLALASHQRDVLRRQRQRQRHAQSIKERQEAARQEAIAQQSEASRERGAQSVTNRAQVLSIQQTLARRREERDNANAEARREREAEERRMDELKMRVLARDIEVAAARKQQRLDAMAEPNTARRVTAAEQRRKLWDDSQRDAALQQCAKADQGAARGEEQRQRRAQEAKAARQQRDATTVEVQRRGAEFAGAKQAAVEVVATRRAEMSIAYQEALAKANEERAQETARRLKVASDRRDEQEAAYFDRVTALLDQKTKSFEERDARRSVDTALKRENAKARAEDLATAKAMAEARRERVAQARLLEYQDRQARAEARVEMVRAIRASAYEKTDPPMSV